MARNEIALVTGANRGAGRGIALELAAAGATVYLSGRSVESVVLPEREGTIVETAELIADAGGAAIPVGSDAERSPRG